MSETIPYQNNQAIQYNDIGFRIITCLLGGHQLVAYGEEIDLSKMLLMPYYWYALLPSFCIGFLLFSMIRAINKYLDKKFDWVHKTIQRIGTQLFFALVLPSLGAFLLAVLYFWLRGKNIFDTTYLQYDFDFIVLLLVMINLYYLAYYFIVRWRSAEIAIAKLSSRYEEPASNTAQTFMVHALTKSFPIEVASIAYFYRDQGHVFLRPFQGDDQLISQSLDQVESNLDSKQFFRVARHMIVNHKAILDYRSLTFGKLELTLSIPYKEPVRVSKIAARNFRLWMER